jgi:hypothetical protein
MNKQIFWLVTRLGRSWCFTVRTTNTSPFPNTPRISIYRILSYSILFIQIWSIQTALSVLFGWVLISLLHYYLVITPFPVFTASHWNPVLRMGASVLHRPYCTTVYTAKGAQGGRCVTSGTKCARTRVTCDEGPKVREAPEILPF